MAEHEHPHDADVLEADDGTHEEPPALDPEVLARREAALAQVVQFGDPVLKSKALPITTFDDALKAEIERMGELMDDSLGIGLAATQVGRLRRLLVYRVEGEGPIHALINPEVQWASKEEEVFEEGCLSLRGVAVDVERPIHVRVTALDPDGEPLLIEASGLEARVIQHEMDHLDGVLIIDRAPRDQRREAMRILRERDEAAA
jgi:peptide deformylase